MTQLSLFSQAQCQFYITPARARPPQMLTRRVGEVDHFSLSPLFAWRGDRHAQPAVVFAWAVSPPLASIKPMMRSSPSLFFRLVMTKGRSPRIRLASVSIF